MKLRGIDMRDNLIKDDYRLALSPEKIEELCPEGISALELQILGKIHKRLVQPGSSVETIRICIPSLVDMLESEKEETAVNTLNTMKDYMESVKTELPELVTTLSDLESCLSNGGISPDKVAMDKERWMRFLDDRLDALPDPIDTHFKGIALLDEPHYSASSLHSCCENAIRSKLEGTWPQLKSVAIGIDYRYDMNYNQIRKIFGKVHANTIVDTLEPESGLYHIPDLLDIAESGIKDRVKVYMEKAKEMPDLALGLPRIKHKMKEEGITNIDELDDAYLRPEECAELLDLKESTLTVYISQNKLSYRKLDNHAKAITLNSILNMGGEYTRALNREKLESALAGHIVDSEPGSPQIEEPDQGCEPANIQVVEDKQIITYGREQTKQPYEINTHTMKTYNDWLEFLTGKGLSKDIAVDLLKDSPWDVKIEEQELYHRSNLISIADQEGLYEIINILE